MSILSRLRAALSRPTTGAAGPTRGGADPNGVEKEIRRQREYFEAVFVNNPVAVVTADLDGKVVSWNPMAERLFGYAAEETVGRDLDELVASEESIRTEAVGYTAQVINVGRVEATTRRTRKDGSLVDVELLALPVFVAGEKVGFVAIYHDITGRKRAEAELERLLVAERAQARRQAALFRLSAALATTMEESEIYHCVVDGLHGTLGYDVVALFLVDRTTGDRVLAASVGYKEPPSPLRPGEGLSERPIFNGQLHYVPDVSGDPRYFYGMGGSEVDVPIRIGGEVLGVLVAESRQRDAFSQDDFEVLTAAAQQAGLALEKARLLAAERQRADELDALRTTMAEITAELELSALLETIVERAAGLLHATGGELALYDEDSQDIRIVVSHNLGVDAVGARQKLGEGAMGRVAETCEPLIIEDYSTWEGGMPLYPGLHATLAVPLLVGDQLLGVFSTVSADPTRQFDAADLHLLNLFAQQAAIAVENARLFDQAQREIAERKRFEEEIRRQKEYFEALFVNNPVAVVTADLEGNIVSWNPMAEKLFRYTQEEVIGKDLDALVANHDSIRSEAVGYKNQVIVEGRVQATTKRTRRDGSLVDVELLALPVIVAGEEVGFIAIYVDITDLQEARRQAEAASRAKSVFLASMSHELRTPLNAILGFAQLMRREANLTADQQENLRIINRSGEVLLGLINDVLELSKIEAGRATLNEQSFDLHRLLDGLEDMFRLQAEEKGLTLVLARPPGVPLLVRMDEGKLRQVLMNLLSNAVKFTEVGGVTLRVLSSPPPVVVPGGLRLTFQVEDTGPGIDVHDLEVAFAPFEQTASGRRSHQGTGLGLPISRDYVRLMGGDITASSSITPDSAGRSGTVFEFTVPARVVGEAAVQTREPTRRVVGLEPGQPTYRLLVADEDETNRRLLVKLFAGLGSPPGFEVREACDGQEAVEAWEHWEPHLIWMDMRMPVVDGYEATRRIKAAAGDQAPVIIALTASVFEEDQGTIVAAGCDDVVRKPFREEELFDALVRHLGVRFVYQEELAPLPSLSGRPTAGVPSGVALMASLRVLPSELVTRLRQVTVLADLDSIMAVVDEIRQHDAALAEALALMASDFDHDRILKTIQPLEAIWAGREDDDE
jgi:PAS domain S-box-containing protein